MTYPDNISQRDGAPKKNPYQGEDNKWYWFDEASILSRPYETEEEAKKHLKIYMKWLKRPEGTD